MIKYICLFQLNDFEKVSDRILVHLSDYQHLKDMIITQKKTISNIVRETYNNWLKDRKSAVANKSFRYLQFLNIKTDIYN